MACSEFGTEGGDFDRSRTPWAGMPLSAVRGRFLDQTGIQEDVSLRSRAREVVCAGREDAAPYEQKGAEECDRRCDTRYSYGCFFGRA